MKYLLLLLTILGASPLIADDIKPNSSYLYYQLILSNNPSDWQMLELGIDHADLNDTRILDMVVERVLSTQSKLSNPQIEDVAARLFRLLGNSHNGRYFQVLKDNQSRFYTAKSIRYLKNALSELPESADSSYVQGQTDFSAIAKEVSDASAMWFINPAERPQKLPSIGTKIDDVFKAYGTPDHVQNLAIPYTRTGNYKVFYYGLGIVQFNYINKRDRFMTVQEVMPESITAAMSYSGVDKPLAHAFASAHDKYLRYLVKGGRAKLQKDTELQSILQAKLISMAKTDNKYGVSAMASALAYLHQCDAANLDATLKAIDANAIPRSDAQEVARKWIIHRSKNMPLTELMDDDKDDDSDI